MVRYVSNSSWSRTITNENTYWTIIIFNFQTVVTFFIFECYLWLFYFFYWFLKYFTVFNSWILLTVFQQTSYIEMLSSRGFPPNRCSVNLQKIVRNSWQQQNPWKIYLNKLSFDKNAVLQHAFLYFHRENEINKISSEISFKLFVKLFQ